MKNKVEVSTIECIGVDGNIHRRYPHSKTTLCGMPVRMREDYRKHLGKVLWCSGCDNMEEGYENV